MTFWKPLIAALVAVALFGAYLVDRQRTVARERGDIAAGRIMPFDFVDATRVAIEGEGGSFVLEKDSAGVWYITQPVRLRADEDRVRTIIDNVHATKKTNPFAARNLADYGLESPTTTITVEGVNTDTGQPSKARVLIGSDAPRLSRIYAMVEGEDTIFTALETLRNQTRVSLTDLRDRRLVHVRPSSVTAFEITLPSGPFRIERNEQGAWMMDDGATPANNTMVESALNQLSEARALRILEGEDAPDAETTGIDKPTSVRIVVETPEGESVMTIGQRAAAEETFYAMGSALGEAVGVVRVRDVSTFIQPRREWVTPRFLWARPDEIEQIEIHSAGSMFIVERGEDGIWKFEDQPDSPVHPRRMQELLQNLSNLSGKQLVAAQATRDEMRELYGVRDESYQMAAIMPDGRTEGFIMARTVSRELAQYLVRIQDNSVWIIDAGTMYLYVTVRSDLRDNRIHHGFAKDVARVTFSTDQRSVELVREGRVWRLMLTQGHRQVVPDHLVEQFLLASEELSRSAEVFTATHPPTVFEVEYQDASGAVLHEIAVHHSEEDETTAFISSGGILYEAVIESYLRFQKASDDLLLTGQQMSEQQQ